MYRNPISLPKEIAVHIGFWLIFGYYSFVMISKEGLVFTFETSLFSITLISIFLATFYLNYIVIMPKVFNPFRWKKVLFGYLTVLVFFIALRYLVEEVAALYFFGTTNYAPGTGIVFYFYDNIFFSSKPILLSAILWSVLFLIRTLDYNNFVIREQKNTEIKFLKAQINPHFIFNTLNNIYAMVNANSDKSLPAIEKLSHIMRFTTYEAQKNQIRLSEELEYIRSYIELEELRHYEKDFVKWEIDIEDENQQIPPYLLSPFIENAMKHGTFSNGDPVFIKISSDEKRLGILVENTIGKHKKDKIGGIGLDNLNNRLAILYPKKHKLETSESNSRFKAELQIDFS
ncbi:histidine kinase [Flavobacterium sp.]|uniref:sensor histidine kinase n=1 Tax=Flavobacterium sp. TaxID=239 RepID=UPI001214534E|nr:histidine kinase [Flavobacterium sp.]RZJ70595.1 MAG: histidine kinase [Flavobacterium sp.]